MDLPPEVDAPSAPPPQDLVLGVGGVADTELVRGLMDYRFRAGNTVIGGYGELNALVTQAGRENAMNGRFEGQANLRRLVIFVAHNFDERFRAYTELEWENALACASGCAGTVEIEQAFVDAKLLGDELGVRAGLVLVPMGIINQWHEPPVFHGVQRPNFDQRILPTTWRELGVGVFGRSGQFRYEAYVFNSLDPLRFAPSGFSGSRQFGSLALLNTVAAVGRLEWEPVLGVVAGASFYGTDMGPNGQFFDRQGHRVGISQPLLGYAVDARMRRFGFELRAVWSQFFLLNAAALVESFNEAGNPNFPTATTTGAPASRIEGGYVELAYDVFHELFPAGGELLPFIRFELTDTQAQVPTGYLARPEQYIEELTTGLSYRPIQQIVVKADVQLRNRRLGNDELILGLGLGYMF